MTTRTANLLGLLAVGCGTSQSARTTSTTQPETASEHTAASSDYRDWRGWTKVNPERFVSKGHGGKWVDVYIEARFVDAYRSGSSPAPIGMRVAKAGYGDQAGTQLEALTVMTKMSSGYDAENRDWYYGVFTEDGGTAKLEGKIEMCINCHVQAADRDYLFRARPR